MEKRIIKKGYGNSIVICDNCGKEFKSFACYEKRSRKHRFCSKKCSGEYTSLHNSRSDWTGGYIGKSTGYRYITINGKQIGEHILVAEKMEGRRLKKGEVVHHINGDRLDNRPENLKIMTLAEHTRMHGHKRKRIVKCLRCNNIKEHHGRGLCHNCYHHELIYGRIQNYPLGGGIDKDNDIQQISQ